MTASTPWPKPSKNSSSLETTPRLRFLYSRIALLSVLLKSALGRPEDSLHSKSGFEIRHAVVLSIYVKSGFGLFILKEFFVGEEMRARPALSFKNFVCLFGLSLLAFASLLVSRLTAAQTATGTIIGTVTD